MPTDYTDLISDLCSAFSASSFSWMAGEFTLTRAHDIGSFGWPWRFRHTWTVKAAAATRDALIRRGLIEEIPMGHRSDGHQYRMSLRVLQETPRVRTTPAQLAFATVLKQQESQRAAAPHTTVRTGGVL